VSRATLRKGQEANGIAVLGFPAGHGTELNLARGHLLANLLGGKRVPRNFVTLTQDPVNSPIMRSIEKRIYKAARKGESIQYEVKPIYDGGNEIPVALMINAVGNRGFKLKNVRLNNPAGMFHILDDDF
jgi:large repetitive protein